MTNKIGYIIGGFNGPEMTAENAVTLTLLSTDEDQAVYDAKNRFPELIVAGIMSETEIMADIEELESVTDDGEIGFMVSGYVGDEMTKESVEKIAISATGSDEAILKSMAKFRDFNPVAILSTAQFKTNIFEINKLRSETV